MGYEILCSLKHLTDEELEGRLKSLAGGERDATAQLVAHLAELDTRDLHLRGGYGSLFAYCRDALHLSEHEAYNRIEAARAARRFPLVLVLLASGAVNLTSVRLLAPHLTFENHRLVLDSARGKTRPEVEALVARLAPRPDAEASLRKLPAPRPPAVDGPLPLPPGAAFPPAGAGTLHSGASAPPLRLGSEGGGGGAVRGRDESETRVPVSVETVRISGLPRHPPPSVAPLSPDRYRLQVTIGGETLEKLRLARDLLRHAIPSGDAAALLDRALTALLVDLARTKFAATDAPRASRAAAGPRASADSRHVPAEVKRAVFLRDLGRCAFVSPDGRRCNERAFVEFHHVRPYAAGGEATAANIQLRCRRHNAYEARAFFDEATRFRTSRPSRSPDTGCHGP
jgi:hypothetical protein